MTTVLSSRASERHRPIIENTRPPQLSAELRKGPSVFLTDLLLPTSARRSRFSKSVKWELSQRGSTKFTFILWTDNSAPSGQVAISSRSNGVALGDVAPLIKIEWLLAALTALFDWHPRQAIWISLKGEQTSHKGSWAQIFSKVGYFIILGTSGCRSSVSGQIWSTAWSLYLSKQS